MAKVTIKDFLESGVHFGHQTRRWNPKMAPYIFGEKNKIHIIDLQKTLMCVKSATDFLESVTASGKRVMFVGTKKQAQKSIEEAAKRAASPYINQRWLGGMLTNFTTIRISVNKMKRIKQMEADNDFGPLTKKERGSLMKDRAKLEKNLAGIEDMTEQPGAVIVVDPKREHIAVKEARKLHIPVIALIDTNSDPDGIDYVIPGNDDAIRSIQLMCRLFADAIIRGRKKFDAAPKVYKKDDAAAEEAQEEEKTEEVVAQENAS